MSDKIHVSSGSPMEPIIGFCRAIRVERHIWVAGTAPIASDGSAAHVGDVYGQTRRCIEIAAEAIGKAGGSLDDVVRTRIMLTSIENWRDAARAHGDVFATIRPVATFVEVSRFIDPEWLVEMEFDCFISGNSAGDEKVGLP